MSENDRFEQFAKALGDATRLRILAFCAEAERTVQEIADHAEVRQPTATHHLRLLADARLVQRREEGKRVYIRLDESALATCCGQLILRFAPTTAAGDAIRACGCCDCECC